MNRVLSAASILFIVIVLSFAVPFATSVSFGAEGETETQVVEEQAGGETVTEEQEPEQPAETQGEEEPSADRQTRTSGDFTSDVQALKETMESGDKASVTIGADGTVTNIVMNDPSRSLIILSNSNPQLYENAFIKFNVTGEADLRGAVTLDSSTLEYRGLGSSDVSFRGELDLNDSVVALSRPLFNSVTLESGKTYKYKLKWKSEENCDGIFASHVTAAAADAGSRLKLDITPENNLSTKITTLNAPALGEVNGDLNLEVSYGTSDLVNISQEGNSGIIVNTFRDGKLELTFNRLVYGEVDVTSLTANAGLLVGKIYRSPGDGRETTAVINSGIDCSRADKITIMARESAGGLIGCTEDAVIQVNETADLSSAAVRGYISGGLAGSADDTVFTVADNKTITPSKTVGAISATLTGDEKISSQYAGGLFGVFETSSEMLFPMEGFDLSKVPVLAGGSSEGIVGGFAGSVTINGAGTLSLNPDDSVTIKSQLRDTADVKAYGGAVGKITGSGSMLVKNMVVEADDAGKCLYNSGIAAMVGDNNNSGILRVNNLEVKTVSGGISNVSTGYYGGLAAVVSKGSVLSSAGTVKITTGTIKAGGGVAGFVDEGSAIRLRGKTDLSEVTYASSGSRIGQLAGGQESALIFAEGSGSDDTWKYIRNGSAAFDDIGNYGQVYRLHSGGLSENLIAPEGFTVKKDYSDGTVSISDKDDLARLAVTIQTKGHFSGFNNIDTTNWESLLDDTISLEGDINLAGTGVTGITRDSKADSETAPAFTGSIQGNSHEIRLAVGETYGMCKGLLTEKEADDSTVGNGIIYRHNRLGLFSVSNGSADKLTVAGTIKFEALDAGIAAGAYSACSTGGDKTICGCTFKSSINYKTNEKVCYVGGAFGMLDEPAENTVRFTQGTKLAPTIAIDAVTGKGVDITGGAIGYISGKCPAQVYGDGAVLSADISNSSNTYTTSLAGGYIGIIQPSEIDANKKRVRSDSVRIEFRNTAMDGHRVSLKAGSATGGLLGYMWSDTDVRFIGDEGKYGLYVNDTTDVKTQLNADTNTAGGLVYRADGKWTIGSKGINPEGLKFSGIRNSFGILVCRGANGGEMIGGVNSSAGALYLSVIADWDDAYPISEDSIDISCSPAVFDEFVAFTMTGAGSFTNDVYGVVSLKTSGEKVVMDGSGINTYVNRTAYGKSKTTNDMTRYYYNLDTAIDSLGYGDNADNSVIDTPEELLVWSVNTYAGTNIKKHFDYNDAGITGNRTTIGSGGDSMAELDMTGFSYYPVTVNNRNIDIRNARITFCNDKIESSETSNSNKRTSTGTQHYAMHCGLFRDFGTRSKNNSNLGNYKIACSGMELRGTTGIYGGTSGALISGTVSGFEYTLISNMYTVSLKNCTLNGLAVNGVDTGTSYGPLLINRSDSYSAIIVDELTYQEAEGRKPAATSLIGTIGSENATQVSVSFNRILLPAADNSVFTRASLLHSFRYSVNGGVGSGTYNFTTADRAADMITYGKEIDGSVEYEGRQLWYFDKEELVKTPDGQQEANTDNPAFADYLPYVYTAFNSDTGYHEIAVNRKSSDITEGCGTYSDPYVIRSSQQLCSVADFINNPNGSAGLSITIAREQDKECSRLGDGSVSEHVTYQKSGDSWVSQNGDTIVNNTMHRYIQSAYYYIAENIELDDTFPGLGNTNNPFRGVVTGRLGSSGEVNTVTIKASSIKGFIPYSYGSVVKDLVLKYSGANAIAYEAMSSDDFSPKSFFGGVIGLILGGDNIIDNVQVTAQTEGEDVFSLSYDKSKNLIPTGGYVGAVSGGGVIFRNMGTGDEYKGFRDGWFAEGTDLSTAEDAYKSLYTNHIIGRVISGYAFSEGCNVENTDKNYKINRIAKETDANGTEIQSISTGTIARVKAVETTVNSPQGLMLLSAVIQSGAGAGHISESTGALSGTNPYYGKNAAVTDGYRFGNEKLGKVRNASYEYVGQPGSEAGKADRVTSLADDMYAPGLSDEDPSHFGKGTDANINAVNTTEFVNSPYLVRKYATKQTEFVCASNVSLMKLILKEGVDFDMRGYGSAYVGMTGRYKSNAAALASSLNDHIDRTVPYLICVDGNNATISVDMNVREYSSDNYNCAGAGALFSTAYWYYTSSSAEDALKNNGYNAFRNLTLTDSSIAIHYYDPEGKEVKADNGANAGVGGIVGNLVPVSTSTNYPTALFENINVRNNTNLYSTYSAGSVAGQIGYKTRNYDNSRHTIGSNSSGIRLSYHLTDCSYSGVDITAAAYAGGFIGRCNSYTSSTIASTKNGIEMKTGGAAAGSNSKITGLNSGSMCGGIIGCQTGQLAVNDPDYKALKNGGTTAYYTTDSAALKPVTLSNVNVTAKSAAGGCAGEVADSVRVFDTDIKGTGDLKPVIKADRTGGILGRTGNNSSAAELTFNNIAVDNVELSLTDTYSGGIIGNLRNNTSENARLTVTDAKVTGCSFTEGVSAIREFTSGAAIGAIEDADMKSTFRNFEASDNTLVGTSSSSFIAKANGGIEGCNILLRDNNLEACRTPGLVAGNLPQNAYTRIAGLSIRLMEGGSVEALYGTNVSDSRLSYIAFADYTNTSAAGLSDEEKSKALLGADQTEPYPATSPVSEYTVKIPEEKYLYGDGVGKIIDGEPVVTAKAIVDESKATAVSRRFKYSYGESAEFDFERQVSTFNRNNDADSLKSSKDIPVLKVSGGDTSGVEEYLNIITNGGYASALALNDEQDSDIAHVKAEITVFEWDGNSGSYVKAAGSRPSVMVNKNGTKDMKIRATTEYDNDRSRFSLLTVTFREAGGEYKVQVPVLVRRILEVDFTATLNYGTVFKKSEYMSLGENAHVLESFGNPVTALLTYRYNNAYGQDTEYGWDSYLAAGGSMMAADKSIQFINGRLPEGTKLSLVDCETGRVYTAIHDGEESVSLSTFKDSDGKSYSNRWMSSLMQVQAYKSSDGRWVECTEADISEASAMDKDGKKYRLAGDNDTDAEKYTLAVGRDVYGREIQPEESFYLVINVPLNETTENLSANGYLSGSVSSGNVPVNLNYTLRPDKTKDSHQNTASTYSFLSGYTQSLADNSSDKDKAGTGNKMIPVKREGESGRYIDIDVTDTVTFNSSQTYNSNDRLYYKLDINLHQYDTSGQTASYFATGTEGTAYFYVMAGDKYYTYSDGSWTASDEKKAVSQVRWESTAENKGELSLVLKDSSGNAIDLSGIRKIAADSGGTGFTITTGMDLHMSDPAFRQSIMGSMNNGKTEYTKLNYKAVLAVREDSLSYSSTSASATGIVGYYRAEWGSSDITYSANDIKQLGINCSELDTADGNIATTGVYSLENVINADEKLDQSDRIVYSLRLMKRKNPQGEYEIISNPDKYINVSCAQLGTPSSAADSNGNSCFRWTDRKSSDGGFATADTVSPTNRRFTVSIPVEVRTDNVENLNHFYSNYRLVLTAEMYKGDTRIDYPFNSRVNGVDSDTGALDDHSDYITYTLTRISTDGMINTKVGQ
ncbi:MAG: hypothetical protein PUB75_01680 [Firmicutes bacterium]|nr:hypothetical protein [Bacillota bacterium]